jgi:hypothetical protein
LLHTFRSLTTPRSLFDCLVARCCAAGGRVGVAGV